MGKIGSSLSSRTFLIKIRLLLEPAGGTRKASQSVPACACAPSLPVQEELMAGIQDADEA